MELEFTSDQEDLRRSIRAVLSRECPISLVREVVEKGTRPQALWQQMVQLDWPALTVPEANGGMGFGVVELAVVAEELGRVVAPGPLLATLAGFVPVVMEVGTPEQRERFLRPVAGGERTGTLALADRADRWGLAAVEATAAPTGDGWALSGRKRFVIEGATVDDIAVAARVDGGFGVFVVPAAAARISATPTLDGSRGLAMVDLGGVTVGPEAALGTPGESGDALERALDEVTTALALEIVGTCQAIFDTALEYAKVREQFGVKIGSFQAMKHKFANMFVALEAARATAYYAVAAIAEDDPRRSLAASMAKSLAGDCERRITQEGIQSLGGIAMTWEHDMHLYAKRAKTSALLMGTAEQHRERMAGMLLV